MTSPAHQPAGDEAGLDLAQFKAVRGIIFDVQRMSLHDGPGVRTAVFFKGCPLRCGWCANPESQQMQPQLLLHVANCIACGQFTPPCNWSEDRDADGAPPACAPTGGPDLAGRVDLCPTGALHWAGEWRTAGEVMAEVCRDRPFYGEDGGLTITGGEPTMQPDMCEALLRLARAEGIGTAMETCGHTQWPVLERLLPYLDLVLFDVKHGDSDRHRRHTGVGNRLILANLRRLVRAGATVRVRIPLIPGFNAEPGTVTAIVELVQQLPGPVAGIDLLPYHTLGCAKYAALGSVYAWEGQSRLSAAGLAACAAAVHEHGLSFTIGG